MSQRYFIGDALDLLRSDETEYDAIVTDPPFRQEYSNSLRGLRKPFYGALRDMVGSGPDFDIKPFLPRFQRVCNPLVLVLFCSRHELADLISWADLNQYVWELLTWHKKNPIPFTNKHFLSDTEFIFYARERGAYFPDGTGKNWHLLKTYYIMDSPRREIGRGQRAGKSLDHPCKKPLKIMENLVRLAAPPGAHILDPFAGSGTTLKAASKHGRDSTGYEINPEWEPLLKEACSSVQSQLFNQPPSLNPTSLNGNISQAPRSAGLQKEEG